MKRELTGWWLFWTMLVLLTVVVLGTTGVIGRIVNVVVEREVFERSFQYQEGKFDQIATYRATIAELESKLASPTLDPSTRADIQAQLAALRIQLNTAIELQQRTK